MHFLHIANSDKPVTAYNQCNNILDSMRRIMIDHEDYYLQLSPSG